MGEVYRAKDTKLGREVAIKLLLAEVSADPERLARFDREARVLASLNHNNIATLYGFEKEGDTSFLIMELVEGETLADRIKRGAIPIDEALPLFLQIAEGLEAAHEKGVIHRDLKPANIKFSDDGAVKILDFGLAKAMTPDSPGGGDPALSASPTLTLAATQRGQILGTAAYMAPEQAKGRAVDRRADIWAFGVCLYEMLVGRRLFDGETVSDTLAAVLRADIDLSVLPGTIPPAVHRLLARCLDRDPRTRLRDAGEARIVLAAPDALVAEKGVGARQRTVWPAVVAAVIALLAGVAVGRFLLAPSPSPRPDFAFEISVADQKVETGSMALSADGTQLVFLVQGNDGISELWLRRLGTFGSRRLPGTRGAAYPFWSPDGREIAFFADGQLSRVAFDGGGSRRIASAPQAVGGTWSAEGVILFGTDEGPIFRVNAAGGMDPVAITGVEEDVEDAHVWPVFLADNTRFFFLADASTDEGHRVRLGTLDGSPTEILLTAIRSNLGVDPRGALLLVRESQLVAYPFDPKSGALTGESTMVVDSVYSLGKRHHAPFSVSTNGILAYQRGSDLADLVHLDLEGRILARIGTSERFGNLEFSPDGRRIAFEVAPSSDESLIWVHDVERGVRTLISERGERSSGATWSADGDTVYFNSGEAGSLRVYRKPANGGGVAELLVMPTAATSVQILDCSMDGRWLLANAAFGSEDRDLFLYPLDTDGAEWTPWLATQAYEDNAHFSPDSRWIAFVSDVSGRDEVYVAPVGGELASRRRQISANGGRGPRFNPDGTRIYYRSLSNQLMSVSVNLSEERVDPGVPEVHFDLETPEELGYVWRTFDLSPDGKSLVAIQAATTGDRSIRVRTRWRASLR